MDPITQTIPSHKPFIILCITYYLVCVNGWIQVTQSMPSHKPFIILCITYYQVCVKGYDKWSVLHIVQFVSLHRNQTESILHRNQIITQNLLSSFVLHIIIPSYNPALHTNQTICNTNHLSFSVLHIVWIVSLHRDQTQSIPSHKPDNV